MLLFNLDPDLNPDLNPDPHPQKWLDPDPHKNCGSETL